MSLYESHEPHESRVVSLSLISLSESHDSHLIFISIMSLMSPKKSPVASYILISPQ